MKGVDLTIKRKFIVLAGENGSVKSTLIKVKPVHTILQKAKSLLKVKKSTSLSNSSDRTWNPGHLSGFCNFPEFDS
jgi:ABC-type Mn2+/Zn2+ transport system ATPase subunit